MESTVGVDKSHLLEFIHKKIDARSGGADHFGQHLLRYCGYQFLGPVVLAIACKQQERTRQALLAGVEELIHQILF